MRNWHINDPTTVTISDVQARSSDNSLLFSGTGGYACQIVWLESQTNYVASAYTWMLSGSDGPRMDIELWSYDEGGGVYQEDANGLPTLTGTQHASGILSMATAREEWERGAIGFTTPAFATGTKAFILAFNCPTNDTGDGFYLDDVMLHRGVDTALPYQPHVTDYFYDMNLFTEIENFDTFLELALPNTLIQTNESTGALYLDVFNEIDTSQSVYIFDARAADSQDPASEVQTNYVDNTISANIRAWRVVGDNKRILLTAKPTSTLWLYYEPVSVMVINGSLIVEGSILADRIAANQIDGTHISASSDITVGDNTNDVIRIDGTHATHRLWIGNETAPSDASFSVNKTGTAHATGAVISGQITVGAGSDVDYAYVTGATAPADNADVTETSVNTGFITSGGVKINGTGIMNSAKSTPVDAVSGYFLGVHSGAPYLNLLGADGHSMTFDGTALSMSGDMLSTDFAEPTGTAPGTGWQMSADGSLQAYGNSHVFGGPTFFTDGKFLTTVGLEITGTQQNVQYLTTADFDNTGQNVVYQRLTEPASGTAWQASTVYAVGDVLEVGASTQKVLVAGTSGTAEPAWLTDYGHYTTDNTIVWSCIPNVSATFHPINEWTYLSRIGLDVDGSDYYIQRISNRTAPEATPLAVNAYGRPAGVLGWNSYATESTTPSYGAGVSAYSYRNYGVHAYGYKSAIFCDLGQEAHISFDPDDVTINPTSIPFGIGGDAGSILVQQNTSTDVCGMMFKYDTGSEQWGNIPCTFTGRCDGATTTPTLTKNPGVGGTAWSVSYIGTGIFRITHSLGTSNYSVLATPTGATIALFAVTNTIGTTSFDVRIFQDSVGLVDEAFHFQVILD